MKPKVWVIGSGAFGTVIANIIAEKEDVCIYARDPEIADEINSNHLNSKYLPGIYLSSNIKAETEFSSIKEAKYVFIVVPLGALNSLFLKLKEEDLLSLDTIVVICSKGIDYNSGLLPTQIFSSYFPKHKVCYLAGPNIAQEIAQKLPTAADISGEEKIVSLIAPLLFTKYFRIYYHEDLIGSQVCAGFKNVLAIAAGICEGKNMGINARATLLTRGINELEKIIKVFGGKRDTLLSLSGIADIMLTCNNLQSRNMKFGFEIARGKNPANEAKIKLIEGYHSCKYIPSLQKKFALDLPIFSIIYAILYDGLDPDNAIKILLSRPLKSGQMLTDLT